jgi:hypothetical protein
MKNTIVQIFFIVALLASFHSKAQDFQLPKMPGNKEEFIHSEKDFIAAEKWLETTPAGTKVEQRKLINGWIIMWVTKSPTVTLEIKAAVLKAFDNNSDLTAVFLAGYARYCLENNYSRNELRGVTAGLKAVINCYTPGRDLKKIKSLEKLIQQDKDGKLEDWVRDAISKK